MATTEESDLVNTGSGSEWEYEYDENETEDFYVTIELPVNETLRANHPSNSVIFEESYSWASKRKRKDEAPPKKTSRGKRKRGLETEDAEEAQDQTEQNENAGDTDAVHEVPAKELTYQLLNLHEKTPLLNFNGRVYQCDWANTLGTDMIFVKRGEEEENEAEEESKALHAFDSWDLVACSGVRLVAADTVLKYKTATIYSSEAAESASNSTAPFQPFLKRLLEVQGRKGEIEAEFMPSMTEQSLQTDDAALPQGPQALQALLRDPSLVIDESLMVTPGRRKHPPKRGTVVPGV